MVDKNQSQWFAFDGLNTNYLLKQYDYYIEDPTQVESSLVPIFRIWEGLDYLDERSSQSDSMTKQELLKMAKMTVNAFNYIQNLRDLGHLQADLYPIKDRESEKSLQLEYYNLSDDLLNELPLSLLSDSDEMNSAKEYLEKLADLYMGHFGLDIAHLPKDEREWFYEQIEENFIKQEISSLNRQKIVDEIFHAEGLEQYLQKFYMGQKRFSGEGLESIIPLMNRIIELSAGEQIQNVYIGMAHRARLNALVHVLDQPYEWLLSKFEGVPYQTEEVSDYDRYNSTGDVKYHLGATTQRTYDEHSIQVTMANNPSHLEFVNSVIQGMARAKQDDRSHSGYSNPDTNLALPILVHGDAAMVGQGVNYETFNLANLKAYSTGGSIHIIANNVIGFTTYNEEQLSTMYASDPAKGFGIPVLHVNADHPELVVAIAKLALNYRQQFHKDIVINLIGYRRMGHNELDEPRMTNPVMYQKVDALGTITEVYGEYLIQNEYMKTDEIVSLKEAIEAELDEARQHVKDFAGEEKGTTSLQQMVDDKITELTESDTTVSLDRLTRLNDELLTWDEDFSIIKNLSRSLDRRRNLFSDELKLDWSVAEALAFASILEDGTPIRISGEDAERGTFSHRSMVMKHTETGDNYTPMHHLTQANVSFDIYNSSLSEMAVLGFEYGYSMTARDALVFWEAQFGDFANGAQVIMDQFISGGRKKWGELSGLVLLLPHGYEGAGPEHSSARIERFLQLSAENNWTVANLSTAAQLFHILRRQAKALKTDEIRPLIIFTPKSLLRSEEAASAISEFTEGQFHTILDDFRENINPEEVKRLILTSGRLSVDIAKALHDASDANAIAHIRIEEIYPFAEDEIQNVLNKYKNVEEIVWAQEEPKNMGAYGYMHLNMLPLLSNKISFEYIGRPAMAAPSEGLPSIHKLEQARIIDQAINLNNK